MVKRDVVVIGASAGGLKPLREMLAQVPADLPASIFVVLHMPAQAAGQLVEILSQSGPLPAQWAEDRETARPGTIYVAPPGRHLVLVDGNVRVQFGPRECNARPAVDVLFRSAAVSHGSKVIGIILSGRLDDGARGLLAIKRSGGVAVVMDPHLADEPDMPLAALREIKADHVLSPRDIGLLLPRLIEEEVDMMPAPEDIVIEDRAAQTAMNPGPLPAGDESDAIACPDCGGSLRHHDDGNGGSYRCRLGHAYGGHSLLNSQQDQLEQALWLGVRILADRKRILERLADDYRRRNRASLAQSMDERINELDQEYRVLRDVLEKLSPH